MSTRVTAIWYGHGLNDEGSPEVCRSEFDFGEHVAVPNEATSVQFFLQLAQSHLWKPMPEHPNVSYCARCKVVKALCGIEHCNG